MLMAVILVVAVACGYFVIACPAGHPVTAVTTKNQIAGSPAGQTVVTVAAIEFHKTGRQGGRQGIVAIAAGNCVIAIAATQCVVTAATIDDVITGAAIQFIVIIIAADGP